MQTSTPQLTLTQTRLLATVINTTSTMLDLAKEQDWDAVANLEKLRREDLKRCFEIPVSEDHSELLAEALAVLLHLNDELMSKLSMARDQIVEESNEQSRQKGAAEEYQRMRLVR